ncbi:hypothetical protein THRCLA_20672 [Thraustotheca clavata]|uniref:Uncharacterized protein n=1 Tax=Thraustotheca clavata TaxID=74557 RepID=A0A1W0A4P3_9STRA|nr:hypothetical protein THRCLA_20672 [Thraustotheca clavata]
MPKSKAQPTDALTPVRKCHVYLIARLLNDSASKNGVPATTLASKLLKVALKMEYRIFKLTRGRMLDEKAIKLYLTHLTQQAHRRQRKHEKLGQTLVEAS